MPVPDFENFTYLKISNCKYQEPQVTYLKELIIKN